MSAGLTGQRGLCCCARVPRVRCGGLQRVTVFEWGIRLGFLKGSLWSLTRLILLSCSDIDLALIYEKQQRAVALCPKEHRPVSSRRHVEILYSTRKHSLCGLGAQILPLCQSCEMGGKVCRLVWLDSGVCVVVHVCPAYAVVDCRGSLYLSGALGWGSFRGLCGVLRG